MTTTSAAKLLPCPFCGGSAELDSQQGFTYLTAGNSPRFGTRIAVYCTSCTADVGICLPDFPDATSEQVIEMWNRRALPDSDGWVSVKDRLPEEDTWVIVFNGKWTGIGRHRTNDWNYAESEKWQSETTEFIEHCGPKVTHWCPLPKPPETRG